MRLNPIVWVSRMEVLRGMSDWAMYEDCKQNKTRPNSSRPKRLLHWLHQLEDIVWSEFEGSDDHIVPHPSGEPANECLAKHDCHKKQRCEVVSAIGRTIESKSSIVKNAVQGKENTTLHPTLKDKKAPMLEKDKWSHAHDDVFPSSCDDDYITSVDTKASANCFKNSNEDSVGNEFCTDDPFLGNRAAAVESNLCRFELDDISAAKNDFEFFRNEHEHNENSDLLDYGWPDIGNFEDVDRMFRNSDSTFGQGSASTANELSWFSASSHVIDGSEDTHKSGFVSTSALKSTSEDDETDMKFMPGCDSPIVDHNKKHGSNAFQVNEHNGGDKVNLSSLTQITNESSANECQTDMANTQRKQAKIQDQLGGKRKDQPLAYLSCNVNGLYPMQELASLKGPCSAPFTSKSSQILSQQKQLVGPHSLNHLHSYIPYAYPEYNHPSNQYPVTTTDSSIKAKRKNQPLSGRASKNAKHVGSSDPQPKLTPEENLKKLRQRKHIRSSVANGHQSKHFLYQTVPCGQFSMQKKLKKFHNEVGGDSEVEDTGTGLPAAEADSPTVQRSSCLGSELSDEISLEATSFRQLQEVMERMDIRTKLCIRDSLYRLARSAEQRHNFGATNNTCRDGEVGSGTQATKESNKFVGFMDTETDTNPIDRSIAHLLFYRPLEASSRLSTDALSLESHNVIRGTNQVMMPDQLVSQQDIACDIDDMKLLVADQ